MIADIDQKENDSHQTKTTTNNGIGDGTGDGTGGSTVDDMQTLYCANHSNKETLLRCNRCNKPICMQCAQLTDVGYRCKECIRGVQDKYFNAESWDNPIAFGVSLVVAAIAAPILGTLLNIFWIWGIILAFVLGPSAGGILVQIIRRAVDRRRGRNLRYFAITGIILGVLLGNILALFLLGVFPLFSLPMPIFAFSASATVYRMLN
ncbi:MAG: hypothetical protein AAF639_11095 [Chloroflexota bacterium]